MNFRGVARLFSGVAALPLLLASGCSTPSRNVTPAAKPPRMAETVQLSARAAALREVMSGLKVRGVGIYPRAFKNRISNSEVIEKIELLGFNRIYCYVTSEVELDEHLQELLMMAAAKNIPVELAFFQRDYYRRYHANQLLRPFIKQYPTLPEVIEQALEFNLELPENARISGVTAVIEPHAFDSKNVERSHRQIFCWSENSYGIGLDNDLLMRETFKIVKKISGLPGLPPFTVGVPDFYHEKAAEGKLSLGKIADFEAIGAKVMVMNSGNRPTQLQEAVMTELQAAGGNETILVAIPLATHVSINSGRLRRRDWNDLVRSLEYAVKQYRKEPAFGGVVISPLAVIEFMRQER